MTACRANSPRRRALTLLELVVVIAVLAVLAGMLVPMVDQTVMDGRKTGTLHTMRELQKTIVNRYAVDMRGFELLGGTYGSDGLPRPGAMGINNGRPQSPQLQYLFINPATETNVQSPSYPTTKLGWNGPYFLASSGTYPEPTAVNDNDSLLRTWNSLGFTAQYGKKGDPTALDGWGNPIVIIIETFDTSITTDTPLRHAYIVSAGADGIVDSTQTNVASFFTNSTLTNDLVLKLY
jgi:prepilin-type N-terminal cleavage/methylation domain-containing protein